LKKAKKYLQRLGGVKPRDVDGSPVFKHSFLCDKILAYGRVIYVSYKQIITLKIPWLPIFEPLDSSNSFAEGRYNRSR